MGFIFSLLNVYRVSSERRSVDDYACMYFSCIHPVEYEAPLRRWGTEKPLKDVGLCVSNCLLFTMLL